MYYLPDGSPVYQTVAGGRYALTASVSFAPPADESSSAQVTALPNGTFAAEAFYSGSIQFQTYDRDDHVTIAPIAMDSLGAMTTISSGNIVIPGYRTSQTGRVAVADLLAENGTILKTITLSSGVMGNGSVQSAASPLANGGFVIEYSVADGANNAERAKAQLFTADGVKVGGEVLVSDKGNGSVVVGDVVGLTGGTFVTSWIDPAVGVRGQLFDASGSKAGPAFSIDSTLVGKQDQVSLAALPNGLCSHLAR